jgi:hypothetical protein
MKYSPDRGFPASTVRFVRPGIGSLPNIIGSVSEATGSNPAKKAAKQGYLEIAKDPLFSMRSVNVSN